MTAQIYQFRKSVFSMAHYGRLRKIKELFIIVRIPLLLRKLKTKNTLRRVLARVREIETDGDDRHEAYCNK